MKATDLLLPYRALKAARHLLAVEQVKAAHASIQRNAYREQRDEAAAALRAVLYAPESKPSTAAIKAAQRAVTHASQYDGLQEAGLDTLGLDALMREGVRS